MGRKSFLFQGKRSLPKQFCVRSRTPHNLTSPKSIDQGQSMIGHPHKKIKVLSEVITKQLLYLLIHQKNLSFTLILLLRKSLHLLYAQHFFLSLCHVLITDHSLYPHTPIPHLAHFLNSRFLFVTMILRGSSCEITPPTEAKKTVVNFFFKSSTVSGGKELERSFHVIRVKSLRRLSQIDSFPSNCARALTPLRQTFSGASHSLTQPPLSELK